MNTNFKETWETYVSSWKVETAAEKRAIFEKALAPNCHYQYPLASTTNWDELVAYMLDFHQQIPGGHFVTTYFAHHNDKSIATWQMKSGDNIVLGNGISYGEYNVQGVLTSMIGFFEVPQG
ncbi:MAG: nuclear transport factor 2 family protein [Chloroflexota bacterium]